MATNLTSERRETTTAFTANQPAAAPPAKPDEITVADTGAGLLVFVEADLPGKELAGFADVSDWGAIRDALRARGLGVGATTNLPVFDIDELPA